MTTQVKEVNQKTKTKPQFFTNIQNTLPYLKVGLEGFAGSGKTYTAALIAKGLYKKFGFKKPIAIFDTEKSAKFLKKFFADDGIEAMVKDSKSFADLLEAMRIAEESASVLIIDSISHIWRDVMDSYQKRTGRKQLTFQDWNPIKQLWSQFTESFLRAELHIIMCGRAGFEYDFQDIEGTGKKQLVKTGVKMKVEGETAYEPDLLILMERFEEILDKDNKKVYRQATVIKDRSNLLDGKTFVNPTFENFEPVINYLTETKDEIDPLAENKEGDTASLFDMSDEGRKKAEEKKALLEEIEGLMVSVAPGQSAAEKQWKSDTLFKTFSTRSWTKVTQLTLTELNSKYIELQDLIEKQRKEKEKAEAEGNKWNPKSEAGKKIKEAKEKKEKKTIKN